MKHTLKITALLLAAWLLLLTAGCAGNADSCSQFKQFAALQSVLLAAMFAVCEFIHGKNSPQF